MTKDYPEEIYRSVNTAGEMEAVERAYRLGFVNGQLKERFGVSNQLVGWSNLTAAIAAGERIDWGALNRQGPRTMLTCLEGEDCCKVIGSLRTSGAKDSPLENIDGWLFTGPTEFGLSDLMPDGWDDNRWALWIKGDLPLRKQTADQLEPGTCFKGKCMGEVRNCVLYQAAPAYHEVDGEEVGPVAELRAVGVNLYPRESREGASTSPVNWLASQVEVLEVYGVGTFEAPEGDA